MAFRRGADAAQEAASFSFSGRTPYFRLEDGERAILRFVTDADADENGVGGWITVDQHQMVPTKPQPDDFSGDRWPQVMSAVCRRDEAFDYGECYICDVIVKELKEKATDKRKKVRGEATGRTWALACLREEVREGGRVVGYRNQKREVTREQDGKTTTTEEPAIVIINMAYGNFFQNLQAPASHYGTVLDRDYLIVRRGKELATEYQVLPLDPILVENGERFDLRNPEHLKVYGFESAAAADEALVGEVSNRASDDYYARFFDPTKTPSDGGGPQGAQPPSNDVDEERLKAMQERLMNYQPSAQPLTNGPTAPGSSSSGAQPSGMRAY